MHELFDEGHEEELIQGVSPLSPEMTASSEAMQSEETSAKNDQLSDEDEDDDEDENSRRGNTISITLSGETLSAGTCATKRLCTRCSPRAQSVVDVK